jgi:adenylate cyclase
MYQMMMGATSVSIGVSDENLPEDCDWMPKDGFTELFGLNADATGGDWVVLAENGSRRQNQVTDALNGGFTWSTKRAGGFTDNHRQVLEESRQALVVVMRLLIGRITTQALLQTYLGEDAGTRVYRGDIERGEGLTIRAALWFSDVRGFTKMSGELPRKDLVDVLNSVFEVTQHVIRKYQGQVLKFMGDGCMAIFNGDNVEFQRTSYSSLQKEDMDIEQGATVCHRARLAAAELEVELCKLRIEREEKGLRAASVGVGLHYGDVSYGNVGAADRLDFTVLGSSVNLASRTEGLCSKLEAKVLATGDFVKLDGDPEAWKSRGEHVVKGVAAPVPIYELVEETCNSE